MAYCLDEACFMWGTYIEGVIANTRATTKDPKQAEAMVQMKLRTILREEGPSENPKDSAPQSE